MATINQLFSVPMGTARVEHRSHVEVVQVFKPAVVVHPDDRQFVRVVYQDGTSVLMCKVRLAQIER